MTCSRVLDFIAIRHITFCVSDMSLLLALRGLRKEIEIKLEEEEYASICERTTNHLIFSLR